MMTADIHLRLDRLPDVLAASGTGRTHLYSEIAAGKHTPAIKFGRASVWPRHEVQAILRARVAGATDEQIRQLVRELVEQRKTLMPALGAEDRAA